MLASSHSKKTSCIENVKLLIEKGANLDIQNNNGLTLSP
jgi:ankyrin repeat protein